MWRHLKILPLSELDLPTRNRLQTMLSAAIDAIPNVLILWAFAASGTIGYSVPAIVMTAAILLNAVIMAAIASGATLRMRDPAITGVQVTTACGINLLGLVLAPGIAYVFIVNLFVSLAFGSLHFTRRGFLVAWCLLAVSLTAVLMQLGERVGFALSTPAEQWLCYIVLALAFGRFLVINAAVSSLHARLSKKNRELARATMQLAELATHDELTGLWNRRQCMRLLEDEISRTRRSGSSFCVAIANADHFSAVNDIFGADIGDLALKELARLLEGTMRSADRIGRYGGEEFFLMLVDADPDAVAGMIERMRSAVETHDWTAIKPGLRVTISIGFTCWHQEDNHARMLNRAGTALQRAKHGGRNRIEKAFCP